ncbi:MAG: hypothetical protein WCW40_09455 [Bacteroidota bacterium]
MERIFLRIFNCPVYNLVSTRTTRFISSTIETTHRDPKSLMG